MSDSNNLSFMSSAPGGNRTFGDPKNATDFLLPKSHTDDCSETQTWWFNFFLPELNLDGEIYFWVHSNLKMATGGVWIFQGVKKHYLQSEHFNWKNFMPFPEVTGNSLRLPLLNLTINIIAPLQRHEVLYENQDGTRLHLTTEAVMPPVLRSNNAHFEQPMHATGTLRLRGKEYAIDCMAMRDRSWGEPRPEIAVLHPPTCWAVGISDDGKTSFNFNGTDDPDRNPQMNACGLTKEQLFKDGWIYRNGNLRKIVGMSKLTQRGADGIEAVKFDCELIDTEGEKLHLSGEVVAGVQWSPWPLMAAHFGNHVRWVLDGKTELRGEAQECFWTESIRQMIG